MEIIVWQGIISIHQKTFLEALAARPEVKKVLLVVEQEISPYRKNMGWIIPTINNVELIVSPSPAKIDEIFDEHNDAVHILGGINVGKMMTLALAAGAKRKARMGSLSEPYNKSGWKGRLRHLKYLYLRHTQFRHIQYFLAVGREGVKQYTDLGFNERHVFPWAYFISVANSAEHKATYAGRQKIIFAGRLEEGKGIYKFVCELSKFDKNAYALDIFGSGPDEEKIQQYIADNGLSDSISIKPFMPYEQMIQQYAKYDWVILPSSSKDGWGVVISEGLLNGLKAVTSNICGVSWAIVKDFNGEVFDWDIEGNCHAAIEKMLYSQNYSDPTSIKQWAESALSSHAGAAYYLAIVNAVYNNGEKPKAPWLLNN